VTYLRAIFLTLLMFALHVGCTALVHVGWPPQPLLILVVLAVWLERGSAISRTALPAALLVDLIQPTPVPVVTSAALVTWLVATLVQRQWLTNHSLASLFGLSLLSTLAALLVTGACLWLGSSLNASTTPLRDAWSTAGVIQQLGLEVILTVLLGLLARGSVRFLHSRFLYAPR
jgi:hypothetical protein